MASAQGPTFLRVSVEDALQSCQQLFGSRGAEYVIAVRCVAADNAVARVPTLLSLRIDPNHGAQSLAELSEQVVPWRAAIGPRIPEDDE